jgi:hypothetical protein
MSPKARVMIGLMTSFFFSVMGVSFLLSEKPMWGAGLLFLAAVRFSVVVRQYLALHEEAQGD